jgi:hypothetical protein
VKWDANSRLRLLKRFARRAEARARRQVAAYELKKWSEKDIAGVPGFDVEPVNPAANTFEARAAIGEMFVERGMMTPEATSPSCRRGTSSRASPRRRRRRSSSRANVDCCRAAWGCRPSTCEDAAADGEVQADVQQAANGLHPARRRSRVREDGPGTKVLRILKSDPHHLAIPAYLSVLASPASRDDAKLMKVATEAMQLSLQYWQSLTPDEAAVPTAFRRCPRRWRPLACRLARLRAAHPAEARRPTVKRRRGMPPGEKPPEEGAIEQPKDPTSGEQAARAHARLKQSPPEE